MELFRSERRYAVKRRDGGLLHRDVRQHAKGGAQKRATWRERVRDRSRPWGRPRRQQRTEVGEVFEADGQARISSESESVSSSRVELAFDLNRSLEGSGRSGREVLERAPSRMNGVPDDAPDYPSPI